jgi:hypothetical protein
MNHVIAKILLAMLGKINSYEVSYDLAKNRLFKYDCPHLKLIEMFTLIAIESIIELVHIIPRFGKENEYLVNKFLF